MRALRFVTVSTLLFLLSAPIKAQQSPGSATVTTQDQQALSMLKSSLSALAGPAQGAPASLVIAGTESPLGDNSATPYSVNIYAQGADKFRWEEGLPTGTTAIVVNGQQQQSQVASTVTNLMPWQAADRNVENFPVLLLSRWLNSSTVQFHFVGLETVNGQSVNHISVVDFSQKRPFSNSWHRDTKKGEYEIYLDSITALPMQLHYYQDTSDTVLHTLAPIDIVYSDFRPSGNFIFPYRLTRYLAQTKVSVLQLQTLQLNGPVTVQQFQIQ